MEQIIKKAIEGGYTKYDKRAEYIAQNVAWQYLLCDPEFFQALGKACGWNYVEETEYFNRLLDIYEKAEIDLWLKYSLIFHRINLTESWDKAVEYLQSLTATAEEGR